MSDRSASRCSSILSVMPPPLRHVESEVISLDSHVTGSASHPIILDSPEVTCLDSRKRYRHEADVDTLDLTGYECKAKRVRQSVEHGMPEVIVVGEGW